MKTAFLPQKNFSGGGGRLPPLPQWWGPSLHWKSGGLLGYETSVATYTEDSVISLKTSAVICALSSRYCKSNMASNEVSQSTRISRNVIPLILDGGISYPPNGLMHRQLSDIRPIDCTSISAGSKWKGTPQFDRLMNRLSKVGAQEPASDPDRQDRSQSMNALEDNRRRMRQNEKDSGYTSLEDRNYAKNMQNGYKLPQINNTNGSSEPPPKTYNGQGENSSPPRVRRQTTSSSLNRGRRGYSDTDGPKLPSVHGQRFEAS